MKLTALIPVYNDDYALRFCLASIVGHFDEIVVLDDASTDDTPDVALEVARRHRHVRYVRHEGAQLGWVEARNRLARLTDAEHLFWLDSDDVLCEYNAHLLRDIARGSLGEGGAPIVRLYLTEMWGDFFHTTQRLRHYDRCHVYMNRHALEDFVWTGGATARLSPQHSGLSTQHSVLRPVKGAGPLFFHIKGVKPDRRLVERQMIRGWLRRRSSAPPGGPVGARLAVPGADSVGARYTSPADGFVGVGPASLSELLSGMDEAEIHRLALRHLLHSKQDRLTPTYCRSQHSALSTQDSARAPARPEVICNVLPGRFQVVHEDGHPVDRSDTQIRSLARRQP